MKAGRTVADIIPVMGNIRDPRSGREISKQRFFLKFIELHWFGRHIQKDIDKDLYALSLRAFSVYRIAFTDAILVISRIPPINFEKKLSNNAWQRTQDPFETENDK
ncbi:hypothetical protein HHI36_020102 [Cryptolaemus montrouzieri]|uniref:Uncharacterized protein n=1 Tax=Cryptolaemus montrouzieri TaxID=559131 RepID=A0ABD2NA15_9CUCU